MIAAMTDSFRSGRLLAMALVATLCASCAQIGPGFVAEGRPAYNIAVARTNDQELLLNLVRLRYSDTPYFTHVERIAAQVEFNRSLGAEGTYTGTTSAAPSGVTEFLSRAFRLGPAAVALNEKPSIIYAPVEGEKFVRQMMTPMNPDLLFLLVKAGWGTDRTFVVGVQEIGSLRNVIGAYGGRGTVADGTEEFKEVAQLLHTLSEDSMIEVAKEAGAPSGVIDLRFIGDGAQSPQARRLRSLLGLSPDQDRYRLVGGGDVYDPKTIRLLTRSVLGAMGHLAQGIDVPAADLAAGKVRSTVRIDGTPFDWQSSLNGIFRVRVAAEMPKDASVVIPYRGHYFYIADNDVDTKSTFLLLTQLIALHASPSAAAGLSLSIGR